MEYVRNVEVEMAVQQMEYQFRQKEMQDELR